MEEKPNPPPPAPHRHPLAAPDSKSLYLNKSQHIHKEFLNKARVDALNKSADSWKPEKAAQMHSSEALYSHIQSMKQNMRSTKVVLSEQDMEWAATEASDWRPQAAADLEALQQPSNVDNDSKWIIESKDKVLQRKKVCKQVDKKYLAEKERAWRRMRHPLEITTEHAVRERTYALEYKEITDKVWGALDIEELQMSCLSVEEPPPSKLYGRENLHLPSTLGLHGALLFAEHGDVV